MRSRLSRLGEGLRQRRHHRAFRIGPPLFEPPLTEELERLLAAVAKTPGKTPEKAPEAVPTGKPVPDEPSATAAPSLDEKALADAATSLWRAQRRLARPGETPSQRSRQTARHLRACRDMLADAGLSVQDHDGDAFHSGRSLEVLLFQEDPSLTAETVLETVRPTIYLRDRRIQMGQVIVGSPARDPARDDQRAQDPVHDVHDEEPPPGAGEERPAHA